MKILWITNSPFPEVYEMLNLKAPVTVGWVHSAANALLDQSNAIELGVASFFKGKTLREFDGSRIKHYLLPNVLKTRPDDASNDDLWHSLKENFKPDVIHIHGTEYPHTYSFVRACGADRVVVSIQGLVSVCERYFYGNISKADLVKSITIRDLVRLDTIFSQHKKMKTRGFFERLLIEKVNHFIGRTSWDHDHIWAIHPDAEYHFCNETLRPSFYRRQWSLEKCERYSIFISQAHYPLKGFHQVVKALSIILKHFPSTKVYVAGNNFFSNKGIRISGFGHYINSLIRHYKLEDKIVFTGLLSEEEMSDRFLNSHVFVSSSAIENSPNALGEAQILGVPCIGSVVGGTADMIKHGETGLLYRFEEVEMLASNVCQLFTNKELALKISDGGRTCAELRHHKTRNSERLLHIYSEIKSQYQAQSN